MILSCILLIDIGGFVIGYIFYNIQDSQSIQKGIPLGVESKYYSALKVLGVIMIILTCFLVCYQFYSRQKIRLSIALIKTAGEFTRGVKRSLLIPLITCMIYLVVMIIWILSVTHTYSVGEKQENITAPYKAIKFSSSMQLFFVYQIFAFLWINSLFKALGQFLVACTSTLWYYDQ